MASSDDTLTDPPEGRYRIATVAELTGVPEPTLRAWERRYGVPSPERTASGYRLYTVTAVDEVRAMSSLCDGGMAAAEAAKVVLSRRVPQRTELHAPTLNVDVYEATVAALVDATVRFDVDDFEEKVRRLPLLGGATTILDRVVTPTLREIGDKWHNGDLSIAQERMASQRMSTFLRDILNLTTDNDSRERVVLSCFADEEHELGLLATAIRLATWGYRPVYLGGRMPPSALRNAVESVNPVMVALSVTLTPSRARARELAEEYGAACGETPWVVGGPGVAPIEDLIRKYGGRVVSAEDTTALHALVRELRDGKRPRAGTNNAGSTGTTQGAKRGGSRETTEGKK